MTARANRRIDVLRIRLANHGLSRPRFAKPADVVRWLGAVQAQDWPAAKWSLGTRTRGGSEADVERAFGAGEILRTHVLRPTWHFVLPEDIRWMLALTAPQVRKALAHYNRKLEIDGALLRKSNAVVAGALCGGKYATRAEIKALLADVGIATDVQRLAHIVMEAELDGLICSGPPRGKQHTYALLEERVPTAAVIPREEALARLCLGYFTGHGPAQLKDFAWWSGLSMQDAREALEMNASQLEEATVSGRSFWLVTPGRTPRPPAALLLSIYDEYTIAYRDRSDLGDGRDVDTMLSMGNALTAVIVLEGRIAGTWKRRIAKSRLTVELRPFHRLTRSARGALEEQVERLAAFVGLEGIIV
jgi:hypothetical protein